MVRVGDKVPADMRVLRLVSSTLRVEQGSLTGETSSVNKTAHAVPADDADIHAKDCMVFAGTTVVNGSAVFLVVHTGMATEIGKIHSQIHEALQEDDDTPLKKKLNEFGEALTKIIGLICILVWLIKVKYFLTVELDGWVILGVDRLDMIKGFLQKVLAFEKFLEENEELDSEYKVVLLQIAVPTRSDVSALGGTAPVVYGGGSNGGGVPSPWQCKQAMATEVTFVLPSAAPKAASSSPGGAAGDETGGFAAGRNVVIDEDDVPKLTPVTFSITEDDQTASQLDGQKEELCSESLSIMESMLWLSKACYDANIQMDEDVGSGFYIIVGSRPPGLRKLKCEALKPIV
ncbi:calcium-transporting ATPase 4, endoplasmic reticulum-type-like [Hordeum vulgare]|nr:calcium-transporting ATPase 4, endoplasmic reticulum-type-like [Hordeum vulgare]